MGRLLLTLLTAGVLLACGSDGESRPKSEETPAPEGDHVVAVTIICRYVAVEGGSQVTRDGEGAYCTPAEPHTVDSVRVLRVFDVRALVTVRSRDRDDYVVESRDTEIKVGSPWPPPSP
jgi:hypothetical protein